MKTSFNLAEELANVNLSLPTLIESSKEALQHYSYSAHAKEKVIQGKQAYIQYLEQVQRLLWQVQTEIPFPVLAALQEGRRTLESDKQLQGIWLNLPRTPETVDYSAFYHVTAYLEAN